MRTIYASKETSFQVSQAPAKKVQVYSFFPIDRADCECAKLIHEWKMRFGTATTAEKQDLIANTPYITCPRDKTTLNRYKIVCANCKQIQGYCWASTPDLLDWCDFHYFQWTTGDYWRGCFTPHVSPVTEQLCLECCCGQDTRDFRANMKLPQIIAETKERQNAIGRAFNKKNSKFLVLPAK